MRRCTDVLPRGMTNPGAFPKIFANGRALRRASTGPACAARNFLSQRAKRISHGSIFLCHVYWWKWLAALFVGGWVLCSSLATRLKESRRSF